MIGGTWFQARDLNLAYNRAIRRPAWTKWMFFRSGVWMIEGDGPRRVARNTDWFDTEAMAKDWTDVPWEGGTTPPCCAAGEPITEVAPNASGGLAGWALPGEPCGGAGQGGNVMPIVYDPSGNEAFSFRFQLQVLFPPFGSTEFLPEYIPPGGEFISVPLDVYMVLSWKSTPARPASAVKLRIWWSITGFNFASVPNSATTIDGAYTGDVRPWPEATVHEFYHWQYVVGWHPGDTITARWALFDADDLPVYVRNFRYEIPPFAGDGYGG